MKYKLLQPLPWYGVWYEIDTNDITQDKFCKNPDKFPDFFEPIVEKKTYDDLKEGDYIYYISDEKPKSARFLWIETRSEVFTTFKEAEDEHKRREWAVRKDKFVPTHGEWFYMYTNLDGIVWRNESNDTLHVLTINLWLAFRTREECQDAIDNHDLIRLFYKIR